MNLKEFNECVYKDLEGILKGLNKKYDLKLYSIRLENGLNPKEIVRIRRTLSESGGNELKINQENLRTPNDIFSELNILFDANNEINKKYNEIFNDNLLDKSSKYFIKEDLSSRKNIKSRIDEAKPTENNREDFNQENLIYSEYFNVKFNKSIDKIKFIVVLRNIDQHSKNYFYEFPSLSFMRMLFNYYFNDYYEENTKKIIMLTSKPIFKIYNEDGSQFNRRITRLFFGMIQEVIKNGENRSSLVRGIDKKLNNQYYINDLFEKIDEISTKTYEKAHPFGNILFVNKAHLNQEKSIINYIFEFEDDDKIDLSNSKLIRKLLELTNNESELYLISDHEYIYGVGSIDWNRINDESLFRLEFKGLSRYDLSLINMKEKESLSGIVVKEDEKQIYKIEKKSEILNDTLLSVSFKNPSIGEEGFTSERFKKIVISKFDKDINDPNIELLEKIVRKAREQIHGTMIIITDEFIAKKEVQRLNKQSTLIQPKKIKPEFIKHLTSIDGAIYFDNFGVCYAIGVILDGIVEEGVGDSSRGARFNSGMRYLYKLKDEKCIIAIISEDGTIDLIPELNNEEHIRLLFQSFIDEINEKENITTEEIELFKEKSDQYKDIDYHHYLTVANSFYQKEKYKEAIFFFKLGMDKAGKNYIILTYHRLLANSYLKVALNSHFKKDYLVALGKYDLYIIKENENELTHHDYNNRGVICSAIANLLKEEADSIEMNLKALKDYSKSIEICQRKSNILHYNRSRSYLSLLKNKEALEDLVIAETIESSEEYIDDIKNILENSIELFEHSLKIYLKQKKNGSYSNKLEQYLNEKREKLINDNPNLIEDLKEYDV